MGFLRYLGYTVLSAAIAGALYLTHREVYNAGVEKGFDSGRQFAARKLLRNIDEELTRHKLNIRDNGVYALPKFERIKRETQEGVVSLDLIVNDDTHELRIRLQREVSKNCDGTTFW